MKELLFFRLNKLIEIILPVHLQVKSRKIKLRSRELCSRTFTNQSKNLLDEIIKKHKEAKEIVLFLPGLDWKLQIFQRPQQLAKALAKKKILVFYDQLPQNQDQKPFIEIDRFLYVCNVPVETFNILKSPIIYVLTWNYKFAYLLESQRILYDYIDEIDVFYGNKKLMHLDHDELLTKAEYILTTSIQLYEKIKSARHDALLCPNGVNYEDFSTIRFPKDAQYQPWDIEKIHEDGKPIVGYYGAIARWFDYELVSQLAIQREDLSFILIGPDFDGSLLQTDIVKNRNIHLLGSKPYSELPVYLSFFDVAMIPFKVNKITHATSPIKLFEYMAGGKPVVATPMRETMRYPGVLIADGVDEFSAQIDHALELKNDPTYLETIDEVARNNTWDHRAKQILDAITAKKIS